MSDIDKNAPCLCGSTKKYKHCCQRKEKSAAQKSHPDAWMIPAWLNLGIQQLQAGQLVHAKATYERVLSANPRNTDALHWLGVVCYQQGNSALALEFINQAIVLGPNIPFYRSTLGNVLQALGQGPAAIESYRMALALKPDLAEAHNNLGIALFALGRFSDAIESYQRAIQFQPTYAEAFNNLGVAYRALGAEDKATVSFNRAVLINPNYAYALSNFGSAMLDKVPAVAETSLRKAVALNPDDHKAWTSLGVVLQMQGGLDEARACFGRATVLCPSTGLSIKESLMLAPIMGGRDEVREGRSYFEDQLEKLGRQGLVLVDPIREQCGPSFFLAYHGVNDKDVQTRLAHFYGHACPSLLYVAPHCGRMLPIGKRRRIGFFSKFIARHSVALSFSRVVHVLSSQPEFEVVLISNRDSETESIRETYPDFAGTHIRVADDLVTAREQVAALELDILLYLDIGMDPFSYFLAFARLASVQCVVGGHPVTTGIPAVDYYLSSAIMETDNAQAHYSETLVRLPIGIFYLTRPQLPPSPKTRIELGLPASGRIYLCPVTLFKLHPDFDAAIEQILLRDAGGSVVLVADKKYPSWQSQLERRFDVTIAAGVRDRLKFMPWVIDPLDFMRVVETADVVLDSFHFGIGTTGIPICAVGTPIVTKPSEFMRGRVGLFYCTVLDLLECVAVDTDGYAAKAVSIATNPSERERIKQKMLANNHVLYDNEKVIQDLSDFLAGVEV